MHPIVRDAYKRLLWVGRDRERAKDEFRKNQHLKTHTDVQKAVHAARWWAKEIEGVIKLKKYRSMNQRYGSGASQAADALESKLSAKDAPPPT